MNKYFLYKTLATRINTANNATLGFNRDAATLVFNRDATTLGRNKTISYFMRPVTSTLISATQDQLCAISNARLFINSIFITKYFKLNQKK